MAKEVTSYDDLLSGLARKHFAPVYLLHGEEDFLAAEAMNAIIDALSSLGVAELDMPATPYRVWQAIQAARR